MPTKPRSLWPLRSKTSRSWPILPTVPTLLYVSFGWSPSSKKSWPGGNFLAFRIQILAKAVNSELHALSPSDYQNAFESWRKRLKLRVRRRVVWRNVNVVGKSDRYFVSYWSADITGQQPSYQDKTELAKSQHWMNSPRIKTKQDSLNHNTNWTAFASGQDRTR